MLNGLNMNKIMSLTAVGGHESVEYQTDDPFALKKDNLVKIARKPKNKRKRIGKEDAELQ